MSETAKIEGSAPVQLDDMLTTEQAEKWLQMDARILLPKTKGKKPAIPGFWVNERVVRFHPRTIIAKMAADAGLSPEMIAASLGIQISKP